MPTKAMLMAAGIGTRLRPITETVPKPLVPVLGVSCAQFAMDALEKAGIRHLVANVHYLPERTREGLSGLWPEIRFSDESTELLGSAGGIYRALPELQQLGGSSSFFILNGDTMCSLDLSALAERHAYLRKKHGVTLTMGLLRRSQPERYPYRQIHLDEQGERIVGLGTLSDQGLMYVGCAVVEPEALEEVPREGPSDFVASILRPQIDRGRVGALEFSGHWYDIGSPELWWSTHLALIDGLEQGSLPVQWSQRLRKSVIQLQPGVWQGRFPAAPVKEISQWRGPVFWDGRGRPPQSLGPEAIVYGELESGVDEFQSGAVFYGQSFPSLSR
jgi:NDP-sugar pyrophosphorylase family protein